MSAKSPSFCSKADEEANKPSSSVTQAKGGLSAPPVDVNEYVVDAQAERNLVWKLDLRLLPALAFMYFFKGLDKSNMGNAYTAGLETDLHLVGNQYNIILSVFYIPYVLTAPFVVMAAKRFGAHRALPTMMVYFGFFTLMVITVKNFSGLLAIRWFLGMAEGAFFSTVIWYLTTFYRRHEMARRLSLFYSASSIASAFGGLLAFGVFHITTGPLDNWRYLFLVEGIITLLMAAFAYWYLPKNAAEARFFNEEEKKLAFYRLQVDSSSVVGEKFNWREGIKVFKLPMTYMILGIEMCLGVPLQGVDLFLPVIISRLGYGTIKTNLYTVAPNVSAAAMLLVLAFSSDYTRKRSPFIALGLLFTLTGMLIYASIDVESRLHLAYFACFMMTWGTSAPSVILEVWYNNNLADESRRAMLTSIGAPTANIMGLVASNIFQDKDAPKYIPELVTCAAFCGAGALLAGLLGTYMFIDNKRRDAREGVTLTASEISTEQLHDGPKGEVFRWFL